MQDVADCKMKYEEGQRVFVDVPHGMKGFGKIVGIADRDRGDGSGQTWVVQPDEELRKRQGSYPYSTFVMTDPFITAV